MDLAQLEEVVISWIDNELVPTVGGWKKAALAFAVIQGKTSGTIDYYLNLAKTDPKINQTLIAFKILTEDGQLGDIDTIANSAKAAMQKTGGIDIPVIETKLNSQDVDSLVRYIKEAGVQFAPSAPTASAPVAPATASNVIASNTASGG